MTSTKAAEDVLVDLVRKLRLLASGWGTPAVPIVLEAADAITTLLERERRTSFDLGNMEIRCRFLLSFVEQNPKMELSREDWILVREARAALTREGG